MTPQQLPAEFVREMGFKASDFVQSLEMALPGGVVEVRYEHRLACVRFPDGELWLRWSSLPSRRIALLEIPRLHVSFEYCGLSLQRRYDVQRHFDLVYQRGGG